MKEQNVNSLHFLILNGPNLNMLGIREPHIYGSQTYEDLRTLIEDYVSSRNEVLQDFAISISFFQSNHEGALVDAIQQAYFDRVDGIVFNPAAYTHTSVAIADALKAVSIPAVEVHISDVTKREAFRQVSYVRPYCIRSIMGHGFAGYTEAIEALLQYKTSSYGEPAK